MPAATAGGQVSVAEGLVGELGLVWTQQVSVWTGPGEPAGHLRSMEEARPKETSRLSLHVQAWPAPLSRALPPEPGEILPSSLAGEQEGEGSFQNVSIELQGEACKLEIVSRLLDDQQPNNSGKGGGRGVPCRAAKRSRPRPPENFQSPLPVSVGVQSGDRNHTSQLKKGLRIEN